MEKISKITNVFLNKYNFALVYIALLTLRSVFFLQKYADMGCKLCLFWGIAIILHDLWKLKIKFFKVNNSYITFILCIAFAISTLLNYKYSLYGGIKNLMYCAVFFYVLYRISEDNKETFILYFKRNNDVFILLNFMIAIASLTTFVFNINFIHNVDNNSYKIGFWFNRLNGVCNSNMETMFGLISVALCLINWFLEREKIKSKKILYIANFVVQYIYYALAGSRAATGCYLVMMLIVLVFAVCPIIKEKRGIAQAVIVFFIAILVFGTSEKLLLSGVQQAMAQTRSAISKVTNEKPGNIGSTENQRPDSTEDQTPDGTEDVDKDDDEEDISFDRVENFEGDITNNRSKMWNAAFKIIKEYPIFGIAYADAYEDNGQLRGNLKNIDFTETDLIALKQADVYYHNGYIQMLLCGGVVFSICFVIFVIQVIVKYLKFLFLKDKTTNNHFTFVAIVSIIAVIMVDNFVEVHLLFSGQDGIASILWYIIGCGFAIININAKEIGVRE